MQFWQFVLLILGALVVALLALRYILLPIGDVLENRAARKRRAREREEYRP
jgi:hypothetical protein